MAMHGWSWTGMWAATAGVVSPEGLDLPPAPAPALALAARSSHRRAIRVACLTVAMVAMSLADLQITLTYLRSVGMGEGNPVARFVMGHGSPTLLIAWKCASIALAALIFIRYRSKRITEGATWFSCVVLVWLLLQWMTYSDEAWRLTPDLHAMPDMESALWVRMNGEP